LEGMIQFLKRLSSAVSLIALAVLFAVVTCNILARLIFDLTGGSVNFLIPGAIELASYSLLVFVFGAIPSAVPLGLVRVDVFLDLLPSPVRWLLDVIWAGLLVLLAVSLVNLFAHSGLLASKRGALTQDLELPLWIFYTIITAQTFILAIIALFHLARVSGLSNLLSEENK